MAKLLILEPGKRYQHQTGTSLQITVAGPIFDQDEAYTFAALYFVGSRCLGEEYITILKQDLIYWKLVS